MERSFLSHWTLSETPLKCPLENDRETVIESALSMRWHSQGFYSYVWKVPMNILIKVLSISIVGVLTLGLSGCGCLSPYTPNTVPNQYAELHSEAESLRYAGEYRAAVEKYEQAFKIRPRFRKVIDVSYLPLFKYRIAFCYAKLMEMEGDNSLFIKAEAAIRESYQTATLQTDQIDILYLWGYILFKQARYAEARAKYEELLEIALQRGFRDRRFEDALSNLEKTYLELGEEPIAPRAFRQLAALLEIALTDRVSARFLEEALSNLGEGYLKLGNEAAARRTFGQLAALLEITLQSGGHVRYLESALYVLAEGYLKLGEEVAARRIFERSERLLEIVRQSGVHAGDLALKWYTLGEGYLELGDQIAARRIYRQLLKDFPDSYLHSWFKDEIEERFLRKQ